MAEITSYEFALIGWAGVAVAIFFVLLKKSAPYGRYSTASRGPTLPHRPAWMVMEILSPLALVGSFALVSGSRVPGAYLFMTLWILHYLNRSVVYPLRARWGRRRMPVAILISACVFNLINGSLNGFYFATAGTEQSDWRFLAPVTIGGLLIWLLGAIVNLWSDEKLFKLRSDNAGEYAVPEGGLFEYVSCPNYLGECIEWFGFALLTWSPAALTFVLWTAANLIPRALSHHRWYSERFSDYPVNRKAIIPGIL